MNELLHDTSMSFRESGVTTSRVGDCRWKRQYVRLVMSLPRTCMFGFWDRCLVSVVLGGSRLLVLRTRETEEPVYTISGATRGAVDRRTQRAVELGQRFDTHTNHPSAKDTHPSAKVRGNCRPPGGPWGLGSCMRVKQTHICLL